MLTAGVRRRRMWGPRMALLACLAFLGSLPAVGAEYHVAPNGSRANKGTATSPWSLRAANATVGPGDVVVLHGGTYKASIQPGRNGAPRRPIKYRAAAGQTPIITGVKTAIDISEKSHIVVEGITVRDVGRFLFAQGASHLTVRRCRFDKATKWESCRLRTMGDYFTLADCVITKGSDSVMLEGGSHHLIEGNTFHTASHTCLVLMGVQRSVIRNNRLANPIQKCSEVFTTRARRKIPKRLSEHNLIEGNVFGPTSSSGIQYAGNRSILRRNIFRGCKTGMSWSNYVSRTDYPEAWYNTGNRFYHNVLYGNRTGVLLVTDKRSPKAHGKDMEFGDNVMMSNVLYRNRADRGEKCSQTVQIAFDWDAVPQDASVFYNDILGGRPGQEALYFCDARHGRRRRHAESLPLRTWQAFYPQHARHNIEAAPKFVDPEKGDFRLQPGSPCIDAGGPLTKTRSAGSGKVIPVVDALFFCDGHNVVEGDVVRVGPQRVKIVKVDYQANTLSVDRRISWQKGVPVTLDYHGKGPDMGAFEFRGKP